MKFDRDVKAPGIAFKEATRSTPEYLGQTLTIIPLSVGVGFVVLLGAWLICMGLDLPTKTALPVSGTIMILCVLFAFWRTWADELYMAVERIVGHDLDGDGFVGPPPEPRIVKLEITNPDNNNLRWVELPEELYEKLPMIAYLLSIGKPFSEGAMSGGGRPLSRSEFHQLRDIMFERGMARWRNPDYPTQGIELTGPGRGLMRKAVELRTTHARMRTPRPINALPPGSAGE